MPDTEEFRNELDRIHKRNDKADDKHEKMRDNVNKILELAIKNDARTGTNEKHIKLIAMVMGAVVTSIIIPIAMKFIQV